VAVVPVGKVAVEEVEAALSRAARVLRRPLELKTALPLPQGVEERERGQFRAAVLMARLRSTFSQLGPGRMIGGESGASDKPVVRPDAIVFVTDADLFTAKSDSAFAAILASQRLGIVSLRRLREAFYRRTADPGKQRARLAKELIRVVARLTGAPECPTLECALGPTNMLADLDLKQEKLCRACSLRMFQGTVRI